MSKMRRRLWAMNHISTMRNVSFCCQRSKFSMAKFAFNIVIIFLRRRVRNWFYVSSLILNFFDQSISFHHLLKRLWLLFPFWKILLIFICLCILLLNFLWWFCFWLYLNLLDFIRQSMFCYFKYFTFLIRFLTSIFMFFYSIWSKFSSTLTARNSWIFINFYWTFLWQFYWRSLPDFLIILNSLSI